MTACILCLALLVAPPYEGRGPGGDLPRPAAQTPPERVDDWFGEDKFRHFGASFAGTAFAYAAARTVIDPDPAFAAAGLAAFAAGVAKEIHDDRRGQFFSLRDLLWDGAGVALGLLLVYNTR